MSIATELENYRLFLTDAYNKCIEKGATEIPESKNLQNLTPTIDSISGLEKLGLPVLAQATDNFSAGDSFVGTAVEGATPTIYSVASGLSSVACVSADSSVAMKSGSIGASSTTATIYIKNEDAYTEVVVPLPSMTGATTTTTSFSINEDGTKIVWSNKAFIIVLDVDKENKTATAERIDIDSVNLKGFTFNKSGTDYEMNPKEFGTIILVRKNYLIFNVTAKLGTTTSQACVGCVGKINIGGISKEYVIWSHTSSSYATPDRASGVVEYNGNEVLYIAATLTYFVRLEFSLGEVISRSDVSQELDYITQNGEYGLYNKKVYKINQETGSLTLIASTSTTIYMVDETGQYVASTSAYYKIVGSSLSASLGAIKPPISYQYSGFFKIVDDSYIGSDYKKYTLAPTGEAEYTIAHATSISTGNIYGIVPEAMTIGEVKTVRKLFDA